MGTQGEKSLLYANDTGIFPKGTWEHLAKYNKKFNLVSLDCTGMAQKCWRDTHLSLDTDKDDMSLAVLEGVAFALRHNIDIIRNMGIDIRKSNICGGGTKNKLWLKIIANVLGIELMIPENQEGASLGAALLAAKGVMNADEYAELENKVYKTAETVKPEEELTAKYEKKYIGWRKLYPAVKGII